MARTVKGKMRPMDRAELQAVQAPLKERYREEPASALVTLRADVGPRGEPACCRMQIDAVWRRPR